MLWQSTHLSLAKKLDLSIHELAISPPPPVLVPHGGDRDAHDDRDDIPPDDHHELVVSNKAPTRITWFIYERQEARSNEVAQANPLFKDKT